MKNKTKKKTCLEIFKNFNFKLKIIFLKMNKNSKSKK